MMTETQCCELFLKAGVSERDALIVIDYYRGVPMAHIARDEDLSPSRIMQIVCKTLRKLEMKTGIAKTLRD